MNPPRKLGNSTAVIPAAKANSKIAPQSAFYEAVATTLRNARKAAYRAVNFTMVEAYWNVGRMIVEEEQRGRGRAEYGEKVLSQLSSRLIREFGKGFDETNLRNFRQFFYMFATQQKRDSLRRELTWTHYRSLIRVENSKARDWYMEEAAGENWSSRTLARQINSHYYERLLTSRDKNPATEKMREQTEPPAGKHAEFIKDPIVLEFLGIEANPHLRESELESAIISKLQAFMLELGKGFAFVGRQYRIGTESKDFFIDLVFYNHLLKCFVLIDLKSGELTHQDIGQMDMYVRIFEDRVKGTDDNPTVGLILCTKRDNTVAKYSVLNDGRQLFASRYRLYLPTEEELREEIDREQANFSDRTDEEGE